MGVVTLDSGQLSFVVGFVLGSIKEDLVWEEIQEVDRLIAQALGIIFPLDPDDLQAEVERMIGSLA